MKCGDRCCQSQTTDPLSQLITDDSIILILLNQHVTTDRNCMAVYKNKMKHNASTLGAAVHKSGINRKL